ncbi:MAG: recombination protein RecR [Candidatus Parcubacteria bacterium]|jgi:recombination protein RecR|nr:recombination protein RecR [Candidatus Parcubacteria bacterium]
MDRVEDLAHAFERFPGIGPRQAKRFVYYLLARTQSDRSKLSELISRLSEDVRQCSECMRFWSGKAAMCTYCSDPSRDDAQLMLVEKDQDLLAVERSGSYKGRYFVLGGSLTLSGKGAIREKELVNRVEKGAQGVLTEIVLALSATSEGEHTADHIRGLLQPLRGHLRFYALGRGLATGSELEYADSTTLSAALQNRKET